VAKTRKGYFQETTSFFEKGHFSRKNSALDKNMSLNPPQIGRKLPTLTHRQLTQTARYRLIPRPIPKRAHLKHHVKDESPTSQHVRTATSRARRAKSRNESPQISKIRQNTPESAKTPILQTTDSQQYTPQNATFLSKPRTRRDRTRDLPSCIRSTCQRDAYLPIFYPML
jgi:hypothetical protein